MTPSSSENKDIQEVGQFFNAYAEKFSSIYQEDEQKRGWFDSLMDRWFRQSIYTRFKFTLAHTAKSSIQSVLDIGCGPGHYSVAFLEQGKVVTAIDVAADMLRLTQSRVDATGHADRFSAVHADYMTHELEDKSDAACVMGVFDYVAEPVPMLKKLLADTRREIYISIPNNHGLLALQRKVRYRLKNCPLYLYSRDYLDACLQEAGCREQTEIIEDPRGYFLIIRQ